MLMLCLKFFQMKPKIESNKLNAIQRFTSSQLSSFYITVPKFKLINPNQVDEIIVKEIRK